MNSGYVVTGLAWGDEGKGTMVDWITRLLPRSSVTVVRHNGGSQAAHNVVYDERHHHTFSQFGAGTLAGAHTHLSKHMLVNPLAMEAELEALAPMVANVIHEHVHANMSMDPAARVVTPLHRSANRIRELARGEKRHGSCGQGIGETVRLSLEHPDEVLRMEDLRDRGRTIDRLSHMQKLLLDELDDADVDPDCPDWEFLRMDRATIEYFAERYVTFFDRFPHALVKDHNALRHADNVIFEGAQGILLDEDHGFAPHNTWSKTTSQNAHDLMDEADFTGPRRTIGVTRTYSTRHGAGPFPTESKAMHLPEPHNETGVWQGAWRQGWLDIDLLRYALKCDPRIDEIAVTHLDTYALYGTVDWRVKNHEQMENWACNQSTAQLFTARLGVQLNRPVRMASWGPTPTKKNELEVR